MLDALAQGVDRETRLKHESTHIRLVNLTHVLNERAAMRGQRLEHTASQWAEFEQDFEQSCAALHRLEQQAPARGSPNNSLEDVQRQVRDYQSLRDNLSVEKPRLYQVYCITLTQGSKLIDMEMLSVAVDYYQIDVNLTILVVIYLIEKLSVDIR